MDRFSAICSLCLVVPLFGQAADSAVIHFSAKVQGPASNIYTADAQGRIVVLTNGRYWRDLQPALSSQRVLAFVSNRRDDTRIELEKYTEHYQLFIKRPESEAPVQLSADEGSAFMPAFSPQGELLAYKQLGDGVETLKMVDMASGQTNSLWRSEVINGYSWSPQGEQLTIAAVSDGHSRLLSYDVATEASHTLLSYTLEPADKQACVFDAPSWSPDGRYLAFICQSISPPHTRQLWLYDPQIQQAQVLSPESLYVQGSVDWHPDSQQMLVAALQEFSFSYDEQLRDKVYQGDMGIFAFSVAGEAKRLSDSQGMHREPRYSPDGNEIAYLYSPQLGEAHALELRVIAAEGEDGVSRTLFPKVAPSSTLAWR